MRKPRRQIRLGVSAANFGYHIAAWRHAESSAGGNISLEHHIKVAQTAERGLFDIYFLADSSGGAHDIPAGSRARRSTAERYDPLLLLSALTMVTKNIGLVATASTTFNQPYHVARQFSSLDHLSGGRAGWNVVSSFSDVDARKHGMDSIPDYDTRYERAAEFVDVVRKLWESWEDDSFVRDKASGLYYHPEKHHHVSHRGKYFKLDGTLSLPRTPQGSPVIFQAGASEQGQELAAATADALYAASQTLEQAQAYYKSVKGRMAKYGRSPDELLIMPGIMAVPGRTKQEAEARYDQLQELVEPMVGISQLSKSFGDLSGYDIDGPVPEIINPRVRSRAQIFVDIARRENLSLRGLYLAIAGGNGHRRVIGTPAQIVDAMEEWFESDAADGFNILPTFLPGGLEDVVEMVVPELQRRGLYRMSYEGKTLRANLGVPTPPNRNAKNATKAERVTMATAK